jgi:hypothetical protein
VNQRGQFESCIDPKGNTISVISWTSDGKVAEVQRNDPSTGITESLLYAYLVSPDPNPAAMATTTLRRQVNGDAWTTVRVVKLGRWQRSPIPCPATDHQICLLRRFVPSNELPPLPMWRHALEEISQP